MQPMAPLSMSRVTRHASSTPPPPPPPLSAAAAAAAVALDLDDATPPPCRSPATPTSPTMLLPPTASLLRCRHSTSSGDRVSNSDQHVVSSARGVCIGHDTAQRMERVIEIAAMPAGRSGPMSVLRPEQPRLRAFIATCIMRAYWSLRVYWSKGK
jgi:hypothetical protein